MVSYVERVKRRAATAIISRPPKALARVMATKGSWVRRVRAVTEAFPKKFTFFHPVKCPGGALVKRPKWNKKKRSETYTCPDGSRKVFVRSKTPGEFFRRKYGRCSEFAQGLHAVLKYMGFRSRMVLAYKPGFDHVWVEAWNPRNKKWIRLDPTMKKGSYGYTWHLGPKAKYFKI
jgi:Transglutaminase-like superfamily